MMHDQHRPVRRHQFSRADYYRMAETGILAPDARVELLDGEIVEMSPIGPRHNGIVNRLAHWAHETVGECAICQVQGPLNIGGASEPEPDVALLKPRDDFYTSGHPQPPDVLLLIEVGETSVELDLEVKRRLYASAGIVEYWVADIQSRVLVVHRKPGASDYREVQTLAPGELARPAAFPHASIDLNELFRF